MATSIAIKIMAALFLLSSSDALNVWEAVAMHSLHLTLTLSLYFFFSLCIQLAIVCELRHTSKHHESVQLESLQCSQPKGWFHKRFFTYSSDECEYKHSQTNFHRTNTHTMNANEIAKELKLMRIVRDREKEKEWEKKHIAPCTIIPYANTW